MSRFDAVLFDFDGTVADTGKGIFGGVYHTLAHMGLEPPPEEKLRYFIGPPLHDSFQTVFGFDAETSDAAVKKYREYYREKGMFELTFYDGMEELLVRLRVSGVKTGIASAKPENPGVQPRPAPGIQFVGIPEFTDLGTKVSQEISSAIAGRQSVDSALKKSQKLAEAEKELFNLRIQQAAGQLEKPDRLRTVRRDIARMETVLRERERAS